MELIKKMQTYKNKLGEDKSCIKFYLRVSLGDETMDIAIAPYEFGSKGNTYAKLNMVAKYEK